MKLSMTPLYFNVAALALLHFTNPVMAMNDDQKPRPHPLSKVKNLMRRAQPPAVRNLESPSSLPQGRNLETLSSPPQGRQSPAPAASSRALPAGNEDLIQRASPVRPVKSVERKRLDPPAELSSDELMAIFNAPYAQAYSLLSLEEREEARGKPSKSVQEQLGKYRSEDVFNGAGLNASRVPLDDRPVFASLKEPAGSQHKLLTAVTASKGKVVAVLDDAETRSLSTMGQEYASVFGVYKLYNAETEEPITYIHEVTHEPRPVTFRIAFSKHKE